MYTYIPIIILFLIIYIDSLNKKKEIHKLVLKKLSKRKEGLAKMNEMIKEFIGKECIVYTFQSQVTGIIEKVEDNWICIKKDNTTEIVNIDYINRIREYPRKKNGKKKTVFAD